MSGTTTNDDDLVLELVLRLLGRLTTSVRTREEKGFSAELLAESERESLKRILTDHDLELEGDASDEKSAARRLLGYALERHASPSSAPDGVRPRAEPREAAPHREAPLGRPRCKAWVRQALLGCVDPADGRRFVREVRASLEKLESREPRAEPEPSTAPSEPLRPP